MILTVTLNPAIDKIIILNDFCIHKLHRLESEEMSMTAPGGKGVNVSLTLNMLGDDVIASGFAGGYSGHSLCDSLRRRGITTSFIFTESRTRMNTSILDRKNETLTEINEHGPFIHEDDLQFFIANYTKILQRVELIILAGSLPQGVRLDIYKILIEIAHSQGKAVMLHTSPKILQETDGYLPFLVNPDMRSYHELFGKPLDGIDEFVKVGKHILGRNKNTEMVLFTHRLENVVAVTRDTTYIIRPQNLKIVNMLGYGDAFLAGLIHAFMQKKKTTECLQYASAAGIANIECLYKDLKSPEDIDKNLSRVEIEVINSIL